MADDRLQVAIRLPEEKARKLKSIAAMGGRSIQDILSGAVDDYLALHDSGQAREMREALAGGGEG